MCQVRTRKGERGLDIRLYQEGDEKSIVNLLALVYGEDRGESWWNWYYRDNPAGAPLVYLAWEGSRLAAHRALVPYRVWDGSGEVGAGQTTDAATHPDFRGRGLFSLLTRKVLSEARNQGVAFIFSFPNQRSLPENRRQGWVVQARPRTWWRILGKAGAPASASEGMEPVPPGTRLDHQWDDLWEKWRPGDSAAVVRDAAYVEWRYLRCPARDYRLLAVRDQGLQGWGVLRREGRKAWLVDCLPGEAGPARLLAMLEQQARKDGARFLGLWPQNLGAYTPASRGYIPHPWRAGVHAVRSLASETPRFGLIGPGDTDYA